MRLPDKKFDKYNMHKMIIKPLYLGVLLNIIMPGALLFVCFFMHNKNSYTTPIIGLEYANTLFIVVAVLTLIHSGVALWMRQKLFSTLLVMREEKLEDELTKVLLEKIRPIFIIISIISIYGVAYYFLTTRFQEAAFFVVFSFLVFQVVRPRLGFIQKLIEAQLKLLKEV